MTRFRERAYHSLLAAERCSWGKRSVGRDYGRHDQTIAPRPVINLPYATLTHAVEVPE